MGLTAAPRKIDLRGARSSLPQLLQEGYIFRQVLARVECAVP